MEHTHYDVALSTLYFGLNYGSVLTAYALYQTVSELGLRPVLLPKPDALWTDHYADKNSVANLFIRSHCDVLDAYTNPTPEQLQSLNKEISTYLVGSDIVWNDAVVGRQAGGWYFLDFVAPENKKLAYASCFGGKFQPKDGTVNQYAAWLHRFQGIAVKEEKEAELLETQFAVSAQMVLDPVFLCNPQAYTDCAAVSAASHVETPGQTFLFTSVENCDPRKRAFLLRGNAILCREKQSPLRNFIDINRFPESKELLGLDPAYHIRVEDYLYYIQHSEFVITDNYYAMCMALIFEKPFVVLANEDLPDLYRFQNLLDPLGLSERLVILQTDLKKKEYLFRKPVRWQLVRKALETRRAESLAWLKAQLGIAAEEK